MFGDVVRALGALTKAAQTLTIAVNVLIDEVRALRKAVEDVPPRA